MRFRLSVETWVEVGAVAEAQAILSRVERTAHGSLGSAAVRNEDGALWRADLTAIDEPAAEALAAEDLGPGISSAGFTADAPPVQVQLFAGLRVRDFDAARPWYERLLGEPAFFPHETEAVWALADDRFVYVLEDADRAGHCAVTIFVDDLDRWVAGIAARGLEPTERETYSNGVRKATYRDADANEVGFGGA